MTAERIRIHKMPGAGGAQQQRIQREHNEVVGDLALRAETNAAGRLLATTGHRVMLGPWARADLAAGATLSMPIAAATTVPSDWPALARGSIVGVMAILSAAPTGANVLTVKLLIGGAVKKTFTMAAAGGRTYVATYTAGQLAFLAKQLVVPQTVTPAGWGDTTHDLTLWLLVEV